MKITRYMAAFILESIMLTLLSSCQSIDAQQMPSVSQRPNFTGRYIAAIADGDFLASTYDDGKLPTPNSANDLLSIVNLPLSGSQNEIAQIPASNSVVGAPYALALSPDGRTAFVVETLGATPAGATQREQLPSGQQLVAIDLSNLDRPVVLSRVGITLKPETVDVHPEGDLLAISTQTSGKEIVLSPVDQGAFGQPIEISLHELGIQPDSTRFQSGKYVSQIQWHPSGRYLAVNLDYRDQIAFFELQRDRAGNSQLIPWGRPVNVGKDPFTGQFTPDGRFFLTSNWGRNFGEQVKTLEQRLPEIPGTISVIRLAELGTSAAAAQHQVVSTATTDISPESLAISPDGKRVVTVNMRGTLFPTNSPRFSRHASLTLLALNQSSGQLSKIDDYLFEGILPESVAFDASGNYLAVAVYDYFTPKPAGGIELWQVIQTPKPALRQTGKVIDLGRGVHQVLVAQ